MKNPRVILASIFALALSFAAVSVAGPAPQGITVTGKGRCTKCGAKETVICQSVVIVEAGREKAVYYLMENAVTAAFHEKVGTATKAVTVKGTLQRTGNRLKLTPTSFDVTE